MKLFTVEGSVIDSGYQVYGIFSTKEEAQKFIDDNWIWYNHYDRNSKQWSVNTTQNYPNSKPEGPDNYCDLDEVKVVEYELGVPVKVHNHYIEGPAPAWRK